MSRSMLFIAVLLGVAVASASAARAFSRERDELQVAPPPRRSISSVPATAGSAVTAAATAAPLDPQQCGVCPVDWIQVDSEICMRTEKYKGPCGPYWDTHGYDHPAISDLEAVCFVKWNWCSPSEAAKPSPTVAVQDDDDDEPAPHPVLLEQATAINKRKPRVVTAAPTAKAQRAAKLAKLAHHATVPFDDSHTPYREPTVARKVLVQPQLEKWQPLPHVDDEETIPLPPVDEELKNYELRTRVCHVEVSA